MKTVILFGLIIIPIIGFSQVVDTVAVVHKVDSLIEASRVHIGKREYKEALIVNAEAERICLEKLGRESAAYGNACLYHGLPLYFQGDYPGAEKWYQDAINILEKTVGKEDLTYAQSLFCLGLLRRATGKYKSAEALCLEVKAIRLKRLGAENPNYVFVLNALANLYSDMGHYVASEPLYMDALSLWEKISGKNSPEYAMGLNNLGTLYHLLGRYSDAEMLYVQSRETRKNTVGVEHLDYASSQTNLANLYVATGRSADAVPLYQEALNIRGKLLGKAHPDYALSLSNLANAFMAMDRYAEAESLYVESKAIREKVLSREHPYYINNLHNLALVYGLTGRDSAAESLLREAITIREKVLGKEHPNYANSLNSLANLYLDMGRYAAADSLFLEAKAIREKALGKDHTDYAGSLFDLAKLYTITGRYEAAQALYLEATTIHRELLVRASRYLSEQELSAYEKLFTQNLHAYFSFSRISPHTSAAFTGSCFDNALFHKGFLLTAALQLRHLAQADTASAREFEILRGYRRRLSKEYAKSIAERQNVTALEEEANTLEKQLIRSLPGFKASLQQVTWQEVQRKLKPGEAAIEFIEYQFCDLRPKDSVYYSALVLRSGNQPPVMVPLFEARALAQLLDGEMGSNVAKIDALYAARDNKALCDLIWRPIEGVLKGITTLYCAPSGLLHRINLGAIPLGNGQIFSDRHKLVLLGSTRQLVVPPAIQKLENSAYVAGGIRYDVVTSRKAEPEPDPTPPADATRELPFEVDSTAKGRSWKYIPASAMEAIEISKILETQKFAVQLDTGYDATEESFKHLGVAGASPRTILLATHGFFSPDVKSNLTGGSLKNERPDPVFKTSNDPLMRAGLIFAGANQTWTTGKGPADKEDGVLTAYEISQMNLANTELVVLSACNSGLGDIVGNEGVYGLQRAFKIAGAKYLIMSLWKVNDRSTSEFMTEFYRQWLRPGRDIPGAFLAAQQIMRSKHQDSPYLWAGFVLMK